MLASIQMRSSSTIILLLITLFSSAQQLTFNNDQVDTLMISSIESAYQFDNRGSTSGICEKLILAYDKEINSYIIFDHYIERFNYSIEPDTSTVERTICDSKGSFDISNNNIKQLLTAFSKNVDPKDYFSEWDSVKINTVFSDKNIRRTLKKTDYEILLSIEDFNRIRSNQMLNKYALDRFNKNVFHGVTDYENAMSLRVICNNSEFYFRGSYPNPLRQAWSAYSVSNKEFLKLGYNLYINEALEKILNKDFLHFESISSAAILEDYLKWYFEN